MAKAKRKLIDIETLHRDQAKRDALAISSAKPVTVRLPKAFSLHDGGDCPVDPDTWVEPIVRTAQGLGSGGVSQAKRSEWRADQHPEGLGAIVAYRLAQRGEQPHFHLHRRFRVAGIEAVQA